MWLQLVANRSTAAHQSHACGLLNFVLLDEDLFERRLDQLSSLRLLLERFLHDSNIFVHSRDVARLVISVDGLDECDAQCFLQSGDFTNQFFDDGTVKIFARLLENLALDLVDLLLLTRRLAEIYSELIDDSSVLATFRHLPILRFQLLDD